MVSNDSLERAERRLSVPAVLGRFHRLPRTLQDDYSVSEKVLGTGCSGQVLQAVSRTTEQSVAVKCLSLVGITEKARRELENEVELFLSMDHPRVARLLDVYQAEGRMSLVMECMEGGELFSRVMDREVFPERDAAHTAWQMLLALNYIHSHGIVHRDARLAVASAEDRDIKLENFMYARKDGARDSLSFRGNLDCRRQDTDHLKLIDFGLSKVWEPNTKMEASCGTLGYIAPEVLNKTYSSKCDLWSLGVIVYILLSGCMPFAGSEQHQIVCIMSGMYDMEDEEWTPVSAAAKDFVRKLLVVDPAARMSADEALVHGWIKEPGPEVLVLVCSSFQRVLDAQDRERIPSESRVDRSVVDALRKFEQASKFRRACMSLMAWSLTHEERKSVVDAFLELDTSRRGTIRLHEMRDVLSHFEVAGIFHALDSSHCDEVHYSEFLAAMVSSRIAMHDQLLRSAFARFDDGRGFISRESLQKLLGDSFEGAPVEELLAEVDPEQQGKVSYEQFVSYLRSGSVQEDHMYVVNSVIDGELKRTGGPIQDAMGSPPKPMKRRRFAKSANVYRRAMAGRRAPPAHLKPTPPFQFRAPEHSASVHKVLAEVASLRAALCKSEVALKELESSKQQLVAEVGESSKQQLVAEAQTEASSLREEVGRQLAECASLRAALCASEVASKELESSKQQLAAEACSFRSGKHRELAECASLRAALCASEVASKELESSKQQLVAEAQTEASSLREEVALKELESSKLQLAAEACSFG
eukprot:s3754_g1.t6